MRVALFILFASLLAACSTDHPTEVVLVVDGEFATPTEIDHVDVTVSAPASGGTTPMVTSTAIFDSSNVGFPRSLGILPASTPTGDYIVDVQGRLGNTLVVRRSARFRFTAGQVRMLRVDLLRACKNVTCAAITRTCTEGGLCAPIDVVTDPWRGTPSSQFDAGMSVGPLVVP